MFGDEFFREAPRSSTVCLLCDDGATDGELLCARCAREIDARTERHAARAFRLPAPPRVPANIWDPAAETVRPPRRTEAA